MTLQEHRNEAIVWIKNLLNLDKLEDDIRGRWRKYLANLTDWDIVIDFDKEM